MLDLLLQELGIEGRQRVGGRSRRRGEGKPRGKGRTLGWKEEAVGGDT